MRTEPHSVLLVDDNARFLRILSAFLSKHGSPELTVVATARTSAQALKLAHEHRPEVILLDISLGHQNGLDLIPQLRTTARAIVVLSLHEGSTYERAALAAGADAFVSKASMAVDLGPAIARSLETRQDRLPEAG